MTINFSNIENLAVDLRGGSDSAQFSDSVGSDVFIRSHSSATFSGNGFSWSTINTEEVYAISTQGIDRVELYDSPNDDSAIISPAFTQLVAGTNYSYAEGFKDVRIYAVFGGSDQLELFDTANDDEVVLTPNLTRLSSTSFYSQNVGFATVRAHSLAGGTDRLVMNDSAEDDDLLMTATVARLASASFYFYADSFERVEAYAIAGGNDVASLFDSAGNDDLAMTPEYSRITGDGFYNLASGFDRVLAYSLNGGEDIASLFDSAGDDEVVTTLTFSRIFGTGYYNLAQGFQIRHAYLSGGSDMTYLLTDGMDSDLVASRTRHTLRSGTTIATVWNPSRLLVQVPEGTTARADLREFRSTDNVYASGKQFFATRDGVDSVYQNFATVYAEADSNESPTSDVRTIDYLLETVGDWI